MRCFKLSEPGAWFWVQLWKLCRVTLKSITYYVKSLYLVNKRRVGKLSKRGWLALIKYLLRHVWLYEVMTTMNNSQRRFNIWMPTMRTCCQYLRRYPIHVFFSSQNTQRTCKVGTCMLIAPRGSYKITATISEGIPEHHIIILKKAQTSLLSPICSREKTTQIVDAFERTS